MSQKDGILSLWMGENGNQKRWFATAMGCSIKPHVSKGYFSAECIMKRGPNGNALKAASKKGILKTGIAFEAGRYAHPNTARTALILTYLEMIRLLELQLQIKHETRSLPLTFPVYSSLVINTSVSKGVRDLIPWAYKQAVKIIV